MIQKIPKDKYKSVEIGENITATGYKSLIYDYSDGFNNPKLNDNEISLSIVTNSAGPDFKFTIQGRRNLEKLKESVDFALEIDKEKKNE